MRRDHRSAGEIEVRGVAHLDAAHRDAGHGRDTGDEAITRACSGLARHPLLVKESLARQAEDLVQSREVEVEGCGGRFGTAVYALRGDRASVAQADDQLVGIARQAAGRGRQLHVALRSDSAVRVEKTCEQRAALIL